MLNGSSLKDKRNPKKPAAKMPGFIIGNSIWKKVCIREAPRSLAASKTL